MLDLSLHVVRLDPVKSMVDVSDPSNHNTQLPTDVGANGARYDMLTLFTFDTVLLHMFWLAFRTSVVSSKVILKLP